MKAAAREIAFFPLQIGVSRIRKHQARWHTDQNVFTFYSVQDRDLVLREKAIVFKKHICSYQALPILLSERVQSASAGQQGEVGTNAPH